MSNCAFDEPESAIASRGLAKQSQALQGRNRTRDSQADGTSTKHQASDNKNSQRPLLYWLEHRSYRSENPDGWGRAPTAVVF
jgi:hypothetical protein